MTQRSRPSIVWLDNARIISCFAVVLLHCAGSIAYHDPLYSGSWWWAGSLYNAFSRWSVPFFLMISGALLLSPRRDEPVGVFYRKRLSRILIPLVFWTLVYSIIRLAPYLHDRPALGVQTVKLLKDILGGNPYYHMWYLYMLVGLYLFMPVVQYCVKAMPVAGLRLICGVWLAMAMITSGVYSFGGPYTGNFSIFLGGFFNFMPYCVAGYLIATSTREPRQAGMWTIFIGGGLITLAGTRLLLPLSEGTGRYYFYIFTSITVVPMSLALFALAKRLSRPIVSERILLPLSSLTLGIYLVHPAVLKLLAALHIDAAMVHPIAGVPLLAVIAFVVSAAITWVLAKTPGLRRAVV